jgi:hypothetical protein
MNTQCNDIRYELNSFADLAKAVHGYCDGRKFMALISAYADESYEKDKRVVAIGAFVGESQEWQVLLANWIDRLRPTNLPNPITAFHMTDCETGNGEFSDELGWNHQSRRELIIDLIGIIRARRVALFGVGLRLEDYNSLEQIDGKPIGKTEYHLLLQAVMCGISLELEAAMAPRWETVAYFFDRNGRHEHWANQIHKETQNDARIHWRTRIGPLTFQSKEVLRLLQVADVAAYETMKYLTNVIFSEGRSRKSFEVLAEANRVAKIEFYDGNTLRAIVENKKAEIASGH